MIGISEAHRGSPPFMQDLLGYRWVRFFPSLVVCMGCRYYWWLRSTVFLEIIAPMEHRPIVYSPPFIGTNGRNREYKSNSIQFLRSFQLLRRDESFSFFLTSYRILTERNRVIDNERVIEFRYWQWSAYLQAESRVSLMKKLRKFRKEQLSFL